MWIVIDSKQEKFEGKLEIALNANKRIMNIISSKLYYNDTFKKQIEILQNTHIENFEKQINNKLNYIFTQDGNNNYTNMYKENLKAINKDYEIKIDRLNDENKNKIIIVSAITFIMFEGIKYLIQN